MTIREYDRVDVKYNGNYRSDLRGQVLRCEVISEDILLHVKALDIPGWSFVCSPNEVVAHLSNDKEG